MVCEKGEDVLDINIPVVMLPLDAGSSLRKFVDRNDTGNIFLCLVPLFPSVLLFVDSICSVTLQLYSPKRPAVDVAEVFLWLMAVGTILCASYWSAWTAREEAIEQDKLLKVCSSLGINLSYGAFWLPRKMDVLFSQPLYYKMQDGSDELLQVSTTSSRGVVEITVISAILFVLVASCFLIMLYKLMSFWFIEVLVVLFCIGGVEVGASILSPF